MKKSNSTRTIVIAAIVLLAGSTLAFAHGGPGNSHPDPARVWTPRLRVGRAHFEPRRHGFPPLSLAGLRNIRR